MYLSCTSNYLLLYFKHRQYIPTVLLWAVGATFIGDTSSKNEKHNAYFRCILYVFILSVLDTIRPVNTFTN